MISIILPFMYSDDIRYKNFCECLDTIKLQIHKDYEVIEIKQTDIADDNIEYNNNNIIYKTIYDTSNRGFNLSWCRNVGAKQAKGDILVFMDADFIIPTDYFTEVSKIKDFAAGSNCYIWSGKENTEKYYKTQDINVFTNEGNRFKGYDNKRHMGYGMILIMTKDFYNQFGGFCENFFKYGWEDRLAAYQIMKLLNKDETQIDRINLPCIHLFHEGRDLEYSRTVNKAIYEKLITKDYKWLCQECSKGGDINHPYEIKLEE